MLHKHWHTQIMAAVLGDVTAALHITHERRTFNNLPTPSVCSVADLENQSDIIEQQIMALFECTTSSHDKRRGAVSQGVN